MCLQAGVGYVGVVVLLAEADVGGAEVLAELL